MIRIAPASQGRSLFDCSSILKPWMFASMDQMPTTKYQISSIFFFVRCCLGKSRAERPSVSEVKVRSQSFCTCTTNEITKTCNSSAGRAIAPMPLRGGQARRKTLWERSNPIGNANRQVEAMTGAALHLVA